MGPRCLGVLVIAVVFSCAFSTMLLRAEGQYAEAVKQARMLGHLDTSKNSITIWLNQRAPILKNHPRRDGPQRTVMPGAGMRIRKGWKWTGTGRDPRQRKLKDAGKSAPKEALILPVGVATELMRSRLQDEDAQGVLFSSRPKWTLLKMLRNQVPDLAFRRVDKHSLAKLKKLLKWADDAHIVTEVGPLASRSASGCASEYMRNDPQCTSVRILERQLSNFNSQPARYQDIMRYPFSTDLLYWGTFRKLRFDGQGLLFYRNGNIAYNGTFVEGRMDGPGQLLDEQGNLVWHGMFSRGMPRKSIDSLINNFP